MDLLQLEHFLAVVDERTFTRAAEKVCRSQPAISQSIKKLEEELGTLLFARDVHDLCLTESGKLLAEYARRLLRLRDEAARQVNELRDLNSGTVAIAAHESAAVYVLPGPVRAYLQKFPQIKIGVYRSRLDEIPRQVLDREVDLGFVKEEPPFRELKCVEVYADRMILIAPPHHPTTTRRHLRISDLGGEQFVIHHLCKGTTEKILHLFDQYRTRFKVAAELWSFENIKDFVEQEVGLAIVPRITVLRELQQGTLVEVPVEGLDVPRRTLMIFRDQGYLSDAAHELVNVVRQFNWRGPLAHQPAGAIAAAPLPEEPHNGHVPVVSVKSAERRRHSTARAV